MRGWFDAFREAGGPTLYASQRIAATHDNILIALYATFAALFLAFVIIIPGIRRNKVPTFILLTASMFVLASIVICRFSPSWHVASSTILASYKRTTPQKLPGQIGVQIGLDFFNVTLQITEGNTSLYNYYPSPSSISNLQFNEKYSWTDVDEVRNLYQQSLERGLPYPILTIAEVLSMDAAGFAWGRAYRQAGYYAGIALWSALASWVLMNVLFCLVPKYSAYFMLLTGGLLLLCDALYAQLLPVPTLLVRFEQGLLQFSYGWCFWVVLTAGLVCICFGVATWVADLFFPLLLTQVHTSWKYNTKVFLPPGSAPSLSHFHKSASAPTSIIQIRPLHPQTDAHIHHSLSAVNWTSNPNSVPYSADMKHVSILSGCTIVEDPFLEEIDRASNIPFVYKTDSAPAPETPQSRREDAGSSKSLLGSEGAVEHIPLSDVPREGRGYVNPVMWDINGHQENGTEDTRL